MQFHLSRSVNSGNPTEVLEKTASRSEGRRPLLLTEGDASLGRPPSSLLNALTLPEQALVVEHGRRRTFDRGEMLFSQGSKHDGIYIIESGRVRVFYTAPSGREITRAYWDAGNFVGGSEILRPGVHRWSGVAVMPASVVRLPANVLQKLVRTIPNFAVALIDGITFKNQCSCAISQMLGTRSVTERLAHLLLHLMDLYGAKDPEGTIIRAMFTHADLASIVGATRQWVTASLKRMQAEQIVQTRKSWIVVRRPDVLRAMRG